MSLRMRVRRRNGFMWTELVIAMALGLFMIAGLLGVMTHRRGVGGRLLAESRVCP